MQRWWVDAKGSQSRKPARPLQDVLNVHAQQNYTMYVQARIGVEYVLESQSTI